MKKYTARNGNTKVPVYQTKSNGYTSYQVPVYQNGKRRLLTFSDFEKAKAKADLVAEGGEWKAQVKHKKSLSSLMLGYSTTLWRR